MHRTRLTTQLSRRSFLYTLARSTLVIGFNPRSGALIMAAQAGTTAAFERLLSLDGTLHVDDTTPCGRDPRLSGLVAAAHRQSGCRRPDARRQQYPVRAESVAGRHALSCASRLWSHRGRRWV
jgi:hypothetical protein